MLNGTSSRQHGLSLCCLYLSLTTVQHGLSLCCLYLSLTTVQHDLSLCCLYLYLTTVQHGLSLCCLYLSLTTVQHGAVWQNCSSGKMQLSILSPTNHTILNAASEVDCSNTRPHPVRCHILCNRLTRSDDPKRLEPVGLWTSVEMTAYQSLCRRSGE